MEDLKPTSCTSSNCAATLCERAAQVRRGERVADYTKRFWRCTACENPVEDGPLEFVDMPVGLANDAAARDAWQAKFGEPLPSMRPPGRKPDAPRTEKLTILLTEGELAELDRERGTTSRSEYARSRLLGTRDRRMAGARAPFSR